MKTIKAGDAVYLIGPAKKKVASGLVCGLLPATAKGEVDLVGLVEIGEVHGFRWVELHNVRVVSGMSYRLRLRNPLKVKAVGIPKTTLAWLCSQEFKRSSDVFSTLRKHYLEKGSSPFKVMRVTRYSKVRLSP